MDLWLFKIQSLDKLKEGFKMVTSKKLFLVLTLFLLSTMILGGCAKNLGEPSNPSTPKEEQTTDTQKILLNQISQLAQQGKIINCEFPVEKTVIDTVEEKWGKPDKVDYVAQAKGSYATYGKHKVVFGFNKGSQIFDVRSFDDQVKQITMSKVKEVLGKPGNTLQYDTEDMLVYQAGENYELLFIFPKANQQDADPKLDHYNVFYPRGTVNLMADDPGISYLQGTAKTKATNRYEVAGIDDAAAFEAMFTIVQGLVKKDDKSQVAQYMLYPIHASIDGKKTKINNETDFVKHYDQIFNEKVKQALIQQDVNKTFVNYQGVMVGDGEIWFTAAADKGHKYYIYAVNNS